MSTKAKKTIRSTDSTLKIQSCSVMSSKEIDELIENDPERVEKANRFIQLCIENAEDMSECDTALSLFRVHYTKEMAELSICNNLGNRKLKKKQVKKLKNSILCNEWYYNPSKMEYYDNGRLLSAQHRDEAIIEADLKDGEYVLVDVEIRKDRFTEDGLRQIDNGTPMTKKERVRRLHTPDTIAGDVSRCLDYLKQFYTAWGDPVVDLLPESTTKGMHELYIKELTEVLAACREEERAFNPIVASVIFAAKGFGREKDGVKLLQTVNARLTNRIIEPEDNTRVSELLASWIQNFRLRHNRKNKTAMGGDESCLCWVDIGLKTAVEYFSGNELTLEKTRGNTLCNLKKDFDGRDIGKNLDIVKEEAAKHNRTIFAKQMQECYSRIHC